MKPDTHLKQTEEKHIILHLISSLETGGTERQLLLTVSRLHNFNHIIICLKKWGVIGDQLKTLGFPVYFVPTSNLFSIHAINQCKKIIQEHRPKLAITYLTFADFFGRIWKNYWGIPILVCFLRSTMKEWRYFPFVLLNIATQRLADHFFAVSNTVKKFYEKFGLRKNQTDVIYNGIEISEIPSEKSTDLPVASKDTTVLGYIANLRKERGHQLLLKTLHILKEKNIKVCLVLIGDGPYRTQLERLIRTLKLQGWVAILGNRKDVPHILRRLTLYVHPSLYEGMSNALLEAMAAGCPIITTDIPENRELISNDIHGILVPPKNPEAMAEAIQFALKNPEKMRQFGDNARQRARKMFNIDRTVTQLTQLLQKYVDEK